MPKEARTELLFSRTCRGLERIVSKPSPENVHAFRTAARRLETFLQAAAPNANRKLLKRLGRWRRRVGTLRDVDVQLKALRSLKIPEEPGRKSQLIGALLDLREKRERKLLNRFDKDAQQRLRKGLKKAEQQSEAIAKAVAEPLELAKTMLLEFAKQQTAMTEESVHEYRLRCKRIRYIAELSDSAQAKALADRLVRIQDATGDWRDWQILTATAEAHFADVPRSALLTALRNVTHAKFRDAVQACTELRSEVLAQESQRKAATSVRPPRAAAAANA